MNLEKTLEEIKKRINNSEEIVFIINGKERCGMSSMAIDIGKYWGEK